ncbi:MAG: hypothetical protein IJQ34_08070 [Kiritimatiellae bacterium]|nr:hypothetical protein [Kiritimatiellia bacterium]MBR0198076.1 hypothetical protein [Kiritimatiellia bacterium]
MANPKKAIAALLPCPIQTSAGPIKPMTLAMWAALEKIGSPLVTNRDAKDTLELIPSLYLLVNGAEKLFEPDLAYKAFIWADGLAVGALEEILNACRAQIKTVMDVIPEDDEGEKRKKPTGRSPSSRAGRPKTLPSAMKKSSTRSPSRSSAS